MDIDPYVLKMGAINFSVIFCSLILQQAGRAYIAHRFGDDTPRSEGRLTLNPATHIDLLGTIIIPLLASFGLMGPIPFIGWTKPLHLNPASFAGRKLQEAIVILSGAALFFTFALIGTLGAVLSYHAHWPLVPFFHQVLLLNVTLAVFNLLPVPPIEISKLFVLFGLMREKTHARISMFGGFILLFLLIFVEPFQLFIGKVIAKAMIPFEWLAQILS